MPAIIDAATDRLRPVLLTTLTTVLGLAPLLFERSSQAQFLKPTVITLVYGLAFGLVIVLLVVPSILAMQADIGRQVLAFRRGLRAGARAPWMLAGLGLAVLAVAALFAATVGSVLMTGAAFGPLEGALPEGIAGAVIGFGWSGCWRMAYLACAARERGRSLRRRRLSSSASTRTVCAVGLPPDTHGAAIARDGDPGIGPGSTPSGPPAAPYWAAAGNAVRERGPATRTERRRGRRPWKPVRPCGKQRKVTFWRNDAPPGPGHALQGRGFAHILKGKKIPERP